MKVEIRIPSALRVEAMTDLRRSHEFAAERVGFLSANCSWLDRDHLVVLLGEYLTVPDEQYRNDHDAGASIGSECILEAITRILATGRGQFHVHMHEHKGVPGPSGIDRRGLPPMVRSFAIAAPAQASGYLILSKDSAWAEVSIPNQPRPRAATKIMSVGFPLLPLL